MSCGDETCHLSATGRGGVNRDVSCEMWVGCAVRVVLLLTRLLSHKDKDHHRGRLSSTVTDQSQGHWQDTGSAHVRSALLAFLLPAPRATEPRVRKFKLEIQHVNSGGFQVVGIVCESKKNTSPSLLPLPLRVNH